MDALIDPFAISSKQAHKWASEDNQFLLLMFW